MGQNLSVNSVVVASKNQVSCNLAGEAAILQMSSGVYYSLNEVGASIWNFIEMPRLVEDICQYLSEEFEVEVERCRLDTLTLLENLLTHDLIEVCHEVVA